MGGSNLVTLFALEYSRRKEAGREPGKGTTEGNRPEGGIREGVNSL